MHINIIKESLFIQREEEAFKNQGKAKQNQHQ
jgi:hypothetical protein